jgi:tetratricopeptide (TPR) repeat protein
MDTAELPAARPLRKVALLSGFVLALLGAGCSKQQAETPAQHLAQATKAVDQGKLREAEKEFREVLRLAPNDAAAQRQLGTLYFEQGEMRQAFPLLKQAADSQPNDVSLQVYLARLYLAGRQFKQARDVAQQIVDRQAGQGEALVLLASAGVGLRDVDATRKLLENVRAEDKTSAGYHIAQAILLVAQKDDAGAESELKAATAADPQSPAAHSALATFYWTHNDLKQATTEFKTVAAVAPKWSAMRLQFPEFLIKTGAAPEAKQILEQINKDAPDYLPARVLLMRIACAEKQDDDCAARAKNILEENANNFDALYQDGTFKLAKGDVATAAREFEFLNSNFSPNPTVKYQLARAILLQSAGSNQLENQKTVDRAESNLTEAVRLDPNFAPAVLALAELKVKKGSPAAAVDYLRPLVEKNPKVEQAQLLLASAYVAEQNTAEALTIYRRMTELFPKAPQPPFLIGLILLSQRQPVDARKAFEQSIAISSDFLPATEKLVDLDLADHQIATAMNRIQQQIDKNANSAQAFAIRAKIFVAQKDLTRAEADLTKSIELNPKLEPSYLLLSQIYIATNRQQQAIDKLGAFAKDNNDIPTLMQLATIQQSLKHFSEARDAYEKLISFSPKFAPALNNLAVLYADHLGDLDKAYGLAKQASAALPADPHVADTFGWITFERGDYRGALPLLQEAAGKLADQADIQFHLGMVHYMLGNEEASRAALQKAVQASADFPQKADAGQRLAMLAIDAKQPSADARAQLDAYLRQQPKDPVALARLAQLQRRDGAIDQAITAYQKAIEVDPYFTPAIRELAIIYSQRPGEESKAYDLATKAREAYPKDAELAKTLGILDLQRGFYPQSVELLNQAATTRKDDADVQFYLGRAYQELKKWNECKASLERAIALQLPRQLAGDAGSRLANCADMAAQ